MPRKITTLLALLTLAGTGATELTACGDKFLVGLGGGGGPRWVGAVHPTRILVYWGSDPEESPEESPEENPEEDPDASSEADFQSAMEYEGHSVSIVKDTDSLYRQAASGDFEVIMMEVGVAREERSRLEAVTPDSAILPVLNFPTRKEFSAAKKEFGHAVRSPATMDDILRHIEKARPAKS